MPWTGHVTRVGFDDADGIFFGRLAGIREGVSFHAATMAGLRAAFHAAVADYLVMCVKQEGYGCIAHRRAGNGAP